MKTHIDTLPGPEDIHRRVLPNGIVVLVRENFQARSVVITGALEAGAVYEPANAQGTASFVASALMRGTEHYDFASLHDVLEKQWCQTLNKWRHAYCWFQWKKPCGRFVSACQSAGRVFASSDFSGASDRAASR